MWMGHRMNRLEAMYLGYQIVIVHITDIIMFWPTNIFNFAFLPAIYPMTVHKTNNAAVTMY